MHSLRFVLISMLLACGDGSSPASPDAPTAVDAPEAPGDRPLRAPPTAMLISRGAPGAETLYSITPTGERALSDAPQAPWCGSKPFCNLPPNGSIGRFFALQYVGTRAFYVDLDPLAWQQTRVVSVDLETANRVELGAAIDWPAVTPDWPLHFVVASATANGTIWLSLPVENGVALFRTDGMSPVVEVARTPIPPEMTYMESTIEASARGIAWSVRWRRGVAHPDPYAYVSTIFDATGAPLVRVPADVAGAVDGADPSYLVGGVATVHYERANGTLAMELFDLATQQRTPLDARFVWSLAPGGDGIFHVSGTDTTHVVDVATLQIVDDYAGQPWGTAPGKTIYRATDGTLRERDWRSKSERELAPPTSLMLDAMAGRRTPDGARLALGSGAPFSDLSDNVGIELVELDSLARRVVEPAEVSEHYVRRMQFTPDGAWLVYLHPVDGVLQLAGFEVATGEYAAFTTGTDDVRQIVIAP